MRKTISLSFLLVALSLPFAADAELVDHGNGLIYDTVQNLTWYDAPHVQRTQPNSVTWATNLAVTDVNGISITGWRLPNTMATAQGDVIDSELAHLYYNSLENEYFNFVNSGPFVNLAPNDPTLPNLNLWTSVLLDGNPTVAWDYHFQHGFQHGDPKGNLFYAIAVHDGKVGEPIDTDSDGTLDCNDNCPNDPNKTAAGECGCGIADVDTDADGTFDCNDSCSGDPIKTEPGICGCGIADVDTDGDGTLDCDDNCPTDINKTEAGVCGCGNSDADSNNNGTADCNDGLQPPVALPGSNQRVDSDTMVYLDGSNSYDANGTIIGYQWSQVEGPAVSLFGSNNPTTSFFSPTTQDQDVVLAFTLSITDNDGLNAATIITITVNKSYTGICSTPPEPISPANGTILTSLNPSLEIRDPLACQRFLKTRWQISESPDFHGLVCNKNVFDDSDSFQVLPAALESNKIYYWRAYIQCQNGCRSEWSSVSTFTTAANENDSNGNGIPDSQEIAGDTDVNENGIPDRTENILPLNTVVGNASVAIETSEAVTFFQSLDHNSFASQEGMPDDVPLGLFNFRIQTANIGDTIQLTIHFDRRVSSGSTLVKYDPVNGWYDYSEHATFNRNMKSVVIELQDGGFGDIDGIANGVIVDPVGVGVDAESGSSSNGCFINSINW